MIPCFFSGLILLLSPLNSMGRCSRSVFWPGSSALLIWGSSFSSCTSWLRHHFSRKAFPRPGGPAQALLLGSGGTASRPHHSRFTSHCICSCSHTLLTDHTFARDKSCPLSVSCLLICLDPAASSCARHVTSVQQMFVESRD